MGHFSDRTWFSGNSISGLNALALSDEHVPMEAMTACYYLVVRCLPMVHAKGIEDWISS